MNALRRLKDRIKRLLGQVPEDGHTSLVVAATWRMMRYPRSKP